MASFLADAPAYEIVEELTRIFGLTRGKSEAELLAHLTDIAKRHLAARPADHGAARKCALLVQQAVEGACAELNLNELSTADRT